MSLIFLFVSSKIFNHELFGEVAEEKEVKGIISKVMEARRSKSYDSYEILAKYVGKDQVTKLILPLKEVRFLVVAETMLSKGGSNSLDECVSSKMQALFMKAQ